MTSPFLKRVPWEKFLLLWFLGVLMGTSLLWLHFGFTPKILIPVLTLAAGTALGLLWGTTRPRWQKAHCAWCGHRVRAHSMRYDEKAGSWVTAYRCDRCGQVTEKVKGPKA
jgi:hypothetical protein